METPNYYELLEVAKNASAGEIRSAYIKKVKAVHPDRNKEEPASKDFVEVKDAYQILSDPKLRAEYDRKSSLKMHKLSGKIFEGPLGKILSGTGTSSRFFSHSFSDYSSSTANLPIISEEPPRKKQRIQTNNILHDENASLPSLSELSKSNNVTTFLSSLDSIKSPEGGSVQAILELSFNESVVGCMKQVPFTRKESCECATKKNTTSDFLKTVVQQDENSECKICNGSGINHVSSSVQLQIPAGVVNGWIKLFPGEGDVVSGKRGDLVVVVKVTPHPFLRRKNVIDIECDLPISFVQAALGCTLQIPSIRGHVQVLPFCDFYLLSARY